MCRNSVKPGKAASAGPKRAGKGVDSPGENPEGLRREVEGHPASTTSVGLPHILLGLDGLKQALDGAAKLRIVLQ